MFEAMGKKVYRNNGLVEYIMKGLLLLGDSGQIRAKIKQSYCGKLGEFVLVSISLLLSSKLPTVITGQAVSCLLHYSVALFLEH